MFPLCVDASLLPALFLSLWLLYIISASLDFFFYPFGDGVTYRFMG